MSVIFNISTDFQRIESHLGAVINVMSDGTLQVNYNPMMGSGGTSPGFRAALDTVTGQNYQLNVEATLLEPFNDGQRAFVYVESDKPQGQLVPRTYRFTPVEPTGKFSIPFQARSDITYVGILFFDGTKVQSLKVNTFIVTEIPESALELVSAKGRAFGYAPLNGDGVIDSDFIPNVKGCPGEKGEPGCRGPMGLRGFPGKKGPIGMPGIPGPKGCPGDQGPLGLPGPVGATGVEGPQGFPGGVGEQGIAGQPGAQGDPGAGFNFANNLPDAIAECQTGLFEGQTFFIEDECRFYICENETLVPLCSLQGQTGAIGPTGPRGKKGEKGDKGCHGEKGDPGEKGCPGKVGCPGKDGSHGSKGAPGCKGERGAPGKQGPKGEPGPRGAMGPKGCDGKQGFCGAPGAKGSPGKGAPGPRGPPGPAGGPRGCPGPEGPDGPPGPPGGRGPSWCEDIRLEKGSGGPYGLILENMPGIDSNGCKVEKVTLCELIDPEEKVILGLGGRLVLDLGTEIFANLCFSNECPCAEEPPQEVSVLGEIRVRGTDDAPDTWTNLGTIDLAQRKTIETTVSYRYVEIIDVTNISEIYGMYDPPIVGFSFCDVVFRAIKQNTIRKEEICTDQITYGDLDNAAVPVISTNLSVTITSANVGSGGGTGPNGSSAAPGDCTFKIWGTLIRQYEPEADPAFIYEKEFVIDYPIVDTILGTNVSFPPPGKTVENCTIGLVNGRATEDRQSQGGFGTDFYPLVGAVYAIPSGLWIRIFTDLGTFNVANEDIIEAEFNVIVCGRLVADPEA